MVIGMRTVKGAKQLKLDPAIYDALQASGAQQRARDEGEGARGERGGRAIACPGMQPKHKHIGDTRLLPRCPMK